MDDAAISRAQDVLVAKGVKIGAEDLREAFAAADAPPEPDIQVSLGMVEAGRKLWLAHPSSSAHVLLPMLYRAMEQVRRDEETKAINGAGAKAIG